MNLAVVTKNNEFAIGEAVLLEKGYVEGFVPHEMSNSEVEIYLNEILIAKTTASRISENGNYVEDGASFRFALKDLWSHIGIKDRVTVSCDGQNIEFDPAQSDYYEPAAHSQSDILLSKIANGYIFTKAGNLRQSLNANQKRVVSAFELYSRLNKLLLDEFNVQAFMGYGSLLGAIREGGFISNDDDIDFIYQSKFNTPEAVFSEFYGITQACLEQGWQVTVAPGKMHAKIKNENGKGSFDLFWSWVDQHGNFEVSFGTHGQKMQVPENRIELENHDFLGFPVLIPTRSEEMLEQFYGLGWRFPDQGWSNQSKTRDKDNRFILDADISLKIYWNNFYRHNPIEGGSPFAKEVAERFDSGSLVVEMGCGNGRDSHFFSQSGYKVIATDGSDEAISAAKARADEKNIDVTFDVCDVNSPESLDAVLSSSIVKQARNECKTIIVYCRFFLHAIPEEVEAVFLSSLKRNLGGDFCFVAEFRTDQDKNLHKAHGTTHYRRYINPEEIKKRIVTHYGMSIVSEKNSFGLSIYKDEDPHLCRIYAKG